MKKDKGLYIDCAAASEIRDTQGELLSIAGADISALEAGKGVWNCDHSTGFYNVLGRITGAKKIFSEADCDTLRHKYYWDKLKAPYLFTEGYLYDAEDHPHAKATAAIIRNIHKHDTPLKIRASVEGGIIQRDIKDPRSLLRTKVVAVALTFTPANNATLVEPINLSKSSYNEVADYALMKSIEHLAKSDVPSFRSITRHASATTVLDNIHKIEEMAKSLGIDPSLVVPEIQDLLNKAVSEKIESNIEKIQDLTKALTAGYGASGKPSDLSGGGVLQGAHIPMGRGINYMTCGNCGNEQIYMPRQTKCRDCKTSIPFDKLARFMLK